MSWIANNDANAALEQEIRELRQVAEAINGFRDAIYAILDSDMSGERIRQALAELVGRK